MRATAARRGTAIRDPVSRWAAVAVAAVVAADGVLVLGAWALVHFYFIAIPVIAVFGVWPIVAAVRAGRIAARDPGRAVRRLGPPGAALVVGGGYVFYLIRSTIGDARLVPPGRVEAEHGVAAAIVLTVTAYVVGYVIVRLRARHLAHPVRG